MTVQLTRACDKRSATQAGAEKSTRYYPLSFRATVSMLVGQRESVWLLGLKCAINSGIVFKSKHEVRDMPSTAEIIHEAESLPVEERTLVVDSLLRSLNSPDSEMDRKWAAAAKRRLQELRSGQVKPVPGEEVFERIRQRFSI